MIARKGSSQDFVVASRWDTIPMQRDIGCAVWERNLPIVKSLDRYLATELRPQLVGPFRTGSAGRAA
jgi:hypothetical protein